MRKLSRLLTAVAAAAMLTACSAQEPAPTAAETTVPETRSVLQKPELPKPVSPMGEPVILRFYETRTEGCDADTGRFPVLTMTSSIPRAFLPAYPRAGENISSVFSDLQEKLQLGDGTVPGFAELLQQAQSSRGELGEGFRPYYRGLSTHVTRADPEVLSIVADQQSYLGGAYGYGTYQGFSFDPRTGDRLELEDLALEPEAFRSAILEQMLLLSEEKPLSEQLPWLEEGKQEAFGSLLAPGSWYLSPEALVIFAQEEQFGPHAAGIPLFEIPYESLKETMKSQFLPEQKTAEGTMVLEEPIEGCNARIIDDLVLDEQGATLLLTARGRVKNVQLSNVGYIDEFYETAMIWYCSEMEDTVLRLQITVPDTIPDLMLRYETDQGEKSFLITQSGEDGSYFLMEP